MTQGNLISAIEIQREYDIPLSTINYYTNLGILNVFDKKGNIRLYNGNEIKINLGKIAKLKQKGYPMKIIQRYFLSQEYNNNEANPLPFDSKDIE